MLPGITRFLLWLSIAMLLWGCAGDQSQIDEQRSKLPTQSQIRPITALPLEVFADTITVQQFRWVCDIMARDLATQAFILRSPRPPVITIRRIQNKTGIKIDEQIFQETIRAKLIENCRGTVLFRDDESYADIIQEKARQGSDQVTVTLTDSIVHTKTIDRVREREFDGGLLSSSYGKAENTGNTEYESKFEMSQTATVRSKVAPADYFLRGIIYQVNEPHANRPEEGMSYFQYQFRVVDARTGLIVWEKMVSTKMEGQYMAPSSGGAGNSSGTAPSGWPSGQGTVGDMGPLQGGAGSSQGQRAPSSSQVPQNRTTPAQ